MCIRDSIDRDSAFDDKGTYTLKGNLLTLKEENGEISYYKDKLYLRPKVLTDNLRFAPGDLYNERDVQQLSLIHIYCLQIQHFV